MRDLEAIRADMADAMRRNDTDLIDTVAEELCAHDDPIAQGEAFSITGWSAYLRGEGRLAIERYEKALDVFKREKDRLYQSRVYGNMSVAYLQLHELDQAEQCVRQDLAIKEDLGLHAAMRFGYANLGTIYKARGLYAEALDVINRAIDLEMNFGDQAGVSLNRSNLGSVYWLAGRYPDALKNLHVALDGFQEQGNRHYEAITMNTIGLVMMDMQKFEQAISWFLRSLKIHEQLHDRMNIATAYGSLGTTYPHVGRDEEALKCLDKAEEIYRSLGIIPRCQQIQLSRCLNLVKLDRFDEVRSTLATISRDEVEPAVALSYAISAGALARLDGDLDTVKELYQWALETSRQHGYRKEVGVAHSALRDLAKEQMDFEAYMEHSEAYTEVTLEMTGSAAREQVALMERERAIDEERQKQEKERAVLYSTLPRQIADRIVAGADVSGDAYDHAAVLFLDIVGFTTHAAELSAHETTSLLATVFNRFDEICSQHGLTKIKTIGDSYMAVSFPDTQGAENTEHSMGRIEHRAARAALDMVSYAFAWSDGTPIQLRAGIHSGPVVAGVIGTQRLQYDVWGDTVNVASRMESTGEPARIQVSSEFYEQLSSRAGSPVSGLRSPKFTERGEVNIKGKGEMKTYWLE